MLSHTRLREHAIAVHLWYLPYPSHTPELMDKASNFTICIHKEKARSVLGSRNCGQLYEQELCIFDLHIS